MGCASWGVCCCWVFVWVSVIVCTGERVWVERMSGGVGEEGWGCVDGGEG